MPLAAPDPLNEKLSIPLPLLPADAKKIVPLIALGRLRTADALFAAFALRNVIPAKLLFIVP